MRSTNNPCRRKSAANWSIAAFAPDSSARTCRWSWPGCSRSRTVPAKSSEANTVNLDAEQEPAVTMRLLAVRSNHRSELVASSIHDQLSLLERDGGQVVGRTYAKAEGRFALRATDTASGRVQIELVPELHYGEQQQRWNGADGVIRLEAARPKRVFDELKLSAQLCPGRCWF